MTNEVCERLLDCSGGDMRKAITSLQSCWQLYGQSMSVDAIDELSGTVPSKLLDSLWETMVKNRDMSRTIDAMDDLVAQGFSASAILSEVQGRVINADDITDLQKARICLKLSEADHRLADRTDESLVLLDTGCFIAQTMISTPGV